MKFDKIIMNPPYHIGGKIWDKVRKESSTVICLMPLSLYKRGDRYKYIKSLTFIENNFDAQISDNNSISLNSLSPNGKEYEDFLFESFDSRYSLAYSFNIKNFRGLYVKDKRFISYDSLDMDTDFIETATCSLPKKKGGAGFGINGCGYKYNVLKKDYEDCWINAVRVISFKNSKEKDNFSKWWYSAPKEEGLSSKLVIGINLSVFSFYHRYAIPQIDWSEISNHPLWKEGRYDEAVLDAMGLRWDNDSRTKIVKKD